MRGEPKAYVYIDTGYSRKIESTVESRETCQVLCNHSSVYIDAHPSSIANDEAALQTILAETEVSKKYIKEKYPTRQQKQVFFVASNMQVLAVFCNRREAEKPLLLGRSLISLILRLLDNTAHDSSNCDS